MQSGAFKRWLFEIRRQSTRAIASLLSNCKRIERYESNLDEHFQKDALRSLLKRFEYSKNDERHNLPVRHSIPIPSNTYDGTATLRSAIKLYLAFLQQNNDTERPVQLKIQLNAKIHYDWPNWEQPDNALITVLTKKVIPFVRFLHPDIVEKVVQDNERNRNQWAEKLSSRGIDQNCYLWDKSSCAFPGIRRYSGSKEIAFFRKHIKDNFSLTDALRLDDNTFPKHIWSFTFRGKIFQNFGPQGYSLAHLADHKKYKNRRNDEFTTIENDVSTTNFFGLYSCVSNTVYMPSNLIKLTDFNMNIRLLLLHKVQDLYGRFCNIIHPSLRLRPLISTEWQLDCFNWSMPVGDLTFIDKFLAFRSKTIDML
ncbi:MAG: hypothetical protein LBN11_06065 [Tannerella sp.]|jgi:hypothetical protein|nr:hypothetical protein [Tannerella sp.]